MRPVKTLLLAACLGLALAAAGGAQTREMPPAWPYGYPQLPPGVVPAQVSARPNPAPTPPAANPNTPRVQAKGSTLTFTQQQVNYSYGPADWFPGEHPGKPDIVAFGKPGTVRACALCHLADGRGRPENAPLQGLPVAYFVQQIRDFQNGLRRSAEPRKPNTIDMELLSKLLTDEEINASAAYFAAINVPKYIRVVESDTVPTTTIQGEIYFATDDGKTEPIGTRVMEIPEDAAETRLRNPKSGFVAYAPVGSISRGKALSTTGGNGRTIACALCHGADLKGAGPVPNLAGRSPTYLARMMYDIKLGARNGAMVGMMKPVVASLTDGDIVDLVAYIGSLDP
jgi:cytochrome c553